MLVCDSILEEWDFRHQSTNYRRDSAMPSPTSSSSTSRVDQSASPSINALLSEDKWGGVTGTGVTLTYSFPWTSSGTAIFSGHNGVGDYSSRNEQNASSHYGLSTTQQAAARSALQSWANVANIVFSEVADTTSNVGDIRFAFTSAPRLNSANEQAWGWAGYPDSYWPSGGDVWISTLTSGATNPDWSAGSGNYLSLIHELGHALGLKHPFGGSPSLSGSEDSLQYTVMSYTSHPHGLFVRVTHNASGSVSWRSFEVTPNTPMLYDVAAIQYLYGANLSYGTGNDVYTFDPSTPFFRTIWDAGGTDTVSASNFTKPSIIDLQQEHFSKITIESDSTAGYNWNSAPPQPTYDGTDNLAIAYGSVIENAVGGSGNDTLIGNDANNRLDGGGGNDTINGGAGIDTSAYGSSRASHSITRTSTGFNVSGGAEGTDTLTNIERLQFSDKSVALDISGNAGTTAKILGAVFGAASVSNMQYVGIGLSYLDGGMSYQDLMQLALNARLGAGFSNTAEVNLLYQNLAGVLPSAADLSYWVGRLTAGQFSQASLGVLAAEDGSNTVNINLVGLAQTGIEYS